MQHNRDIPNETPKIWVCNIVALSITLPSKILGQRPHEVKKLLKRVVSPILEIGETTPANIWGR